MKKKLLLIALPALMALSGCTSLRASGTVAKDFNFCNEDNLAHEEIFGEAVASSLDVRKLPVVDDETNYKVGYQLHFDDKGDADDSNDVISIRFVAAIKAEYDTMIWSRGVSRGDGDPIIGFGNEKYGSSDKLASTEVFTRLSNGGEDEITAGGEGFVGFTGFIVYSMTNISYETYKDSYIAAMLTLHPEEGDDVVTSVYAIKVEKNGAGTASANSFTFANDKNGFFLKGTIGGVASSDVDADDPTRGDGNYASFTTNVSVGDKFLAVKKTSTLFQVWNHDCMKGDNATTYFENNGDMISPKTAGNYRFYLNTDNKIYATTPATSNVGTSYFLRGTLNEWTGRAQDEFKTDGSWNNTGVLLNVILEANAEFKVAVNDAWNYQWNYWGYQLNGAEYWRGEGNSNVIGGAKGNFEAAEGNNIKCKTAGTYNFYLTDTNYLSVELAA